MATVKELAYVGPAPRTQAGACLQRTALHRTGASGLKSLAWEGETSTLVASRAPRCLLLRGAGAGLHSVRWKPNWREGCCFPGSCDRERQDPVCPLCSMLRGSHWGRCCPSDKGGVWGRLCLSRWGAPGIRGGAGDAAQPPAPRSWPPEEPEPMREGAVRITMLMKLGLFSRPAMSKLPTPPVCGEKSPGEWS